MIELSQVFNGSTPQLATFFISMIPIGEHRAAIPIAIGSFGLPWYQAMAISLLGNLVPVTILVYGVDTLSKVLSRHSRFFERFFVWFFDRTRRKYKNGFEKWGAFALLLFVAIPFPLTGGYSGAVASFIFGIRGIKAVGLIFCGLVISSTIITLTSLGVFS
jgi:uncharacterized membrane protein